MHPSNRAERRHQRDRVIAKRRLIYLRVWGHSAYEVQHLTNPLHFFYHPELPDWGRYAKWNLNCGSPGCHREKYFGPKRKRREALKRSTQLWERD